MDEEKKLNFHSESLQQIIDNYISEKREYRGFEPLLSEIFQRRAVEFEYTDQEMEEQIKRFVTHVSTICFKPEGIISKKTGAHYHPATGTIAFNQDYFNYLKNTSMNNPKFDCGEYMFEEFTHEVYHVLTHIKPNEIGLSKNTPFGVVDTTINEAFTEAAASRTVFNRTEKDFINRTRKVGGYQDIVFVPELIANIIGESEKTVLKAGMAGSKELENLILSKYPKHLHKDVKKGFNKFKLHLDEFYKRNQIPLEKLTTRDKEMLERSISEMENVSHELLFHQIKNDFRPCTSELSGEYEYRLYSIRNLLDETYGDCVRNNIFNKEDRERYNKKTENKRKRVFKVNQNIERVAYLRNQGVDESVLKVLDKYVKDNTLEEKAEEIKEKYGLDIFLVNEHRKKYYNENKQHYRLPNINGYQDRIKKEDYHDFAEWDNTFESIETMNILNKRAKRFNIYKALGLVVKGAKVVSKGVYKLVSKIFGFEKNKKALPSGEDHTDSEEKKKQPTFDDEIRVDTSKINFRVNQNVVENNITLSSDKSRNEGR